jgi:hypothetical protein
LGTEILSSLRKQKTKKNAETTYTATTLSLLGFLIICHSYGGHFSDYQFCSANYKNILENSNLPNVLPFLLTWHANSAELDASVFLCLPSLRLPVLGTLKQYSKILEYENRVKTAALGTLKRYSIFSLTLYLE